MLRIVDGIVFEGKPSSDRYVVTLSDLGNGHREAVIARAIDWVEDGPLDPDSITAQILRGEREDPQAAEKREANRRRAARRAKTRVRRLAKAQGCDTLLTLTYRGNQTDLALCKHHFQVFSKRMARLLGGWVYVAAFEPQKRGAWHVHVATHALPLVVKHPRTGETIRAKSFNIVRAMWRDVVGEWGGNIDQKRRKRNSKKSAAKIAAYLSKYILKAFQEGEDFSKRYLASRCALPERVRLEFVATTMADLIEQCVLEVTQSGAMLCSAWVSRFGDTVYLAGEPDVGRHSIHCH